jgi:5-formyltetrahydrofolate cyclo-ligase
MNHSPGFGARKPSEPAAFAAAAAKAELRRQYRRWRRERVAAAAAGATSSMTLQPGGAGSRWGGPVEGGSVLLAALREVPALLAPGQRLGLYWPLVGEEDLLPLAASGLALALPAIEGGTTPARPEPSPVAAKPWPEPARMVYRPWGPGDPVAPDGCGIAAPLPSRGNLPPSALGLVLAPALAFDPVSGIRLGHGGGWYDRLRADPAWAAVPALAVLPAACLRHGLPREPWDVPFPGWLDGDGIHRLQAL